MPKFSSLLTISLAAALVVSVGEVHSSDVATDGNSLLRKCGAVVRLQDDYDASIDTSDFNYCVGFLRGTHGVMVAAAEEEELAGHKRYLCMPSIQLGQMARIVVNYLRDHPEHLHYDEVLLTMRAFRDAFPCKN